MTVKGSLELKQISVLADVDGLNAGTIDLDVKGHSCTMSPAVAQKRPHVLAAESSEGDGEATEALAARSGLCGGVFGGGVGEDS